MNDPGPGDPIANDAEAVDNLMESDERNETEKDLEVFLEPSRWWFVSTAFPLIAGTFGPMASAFSICALSIPWRVHVPPGTIEAFGTYIDDPPWLIGINAAQLFIALISNLFLLLNMAESVRFSIAQPITIVGWFISSFALVGLIAAVSILSRIKPDQDTTYSQAFYYAIFSAGLYFFVASLMLVTAIVASIGFCSKEFKLTMSQRTLMLQTITFLVYLLGGSAVFAHVEGWYFLDSVYFTDYTLLTVGIGDITPTTNLGRGLLFPYGIGGIIILGLVIGSIRSMVLDRGKAKLDARILEKERERFLKKIRVGERMPLDGEKQDEGDDEISLTERERREKEFNMMRKVQKNTAIKKRWTALAISATTWFGLWFIGAVIFRVTENDEQQWSYFQALYFSYTSLLTIGYGDLFPISNAGKSFFVYWSLLAVPSLTILISNMGDTIVKGFRDITLWVGTVTLLPDEHGIQASLKMAVHKITRGRVSHGNVKEIPPGILGEMQAHSDTGNRERSRAKEHHADAQNAPEGKMDKGRVIPKNKHHYHAVLIKEISSVMRHLNSQPPRKYSFDEWTWYLSLIGEDDSSVEAHGQATRHPTADSGGLGSKTGQKRGEQVHAKWSWVGKSSPLMGNTEEAEWVLERLTKTLKRELEAMVGKEVRLDLEEVNGEEGQDPPFGEAITEVTGRLR